MAEAEVLPHADVLGAQRADEDVVDEALRAAPGEVRVERDDDELLDAELARSSSALRSSVVSRRGAPPGATTAARVRLEGDDGVGAADDLAVAEVDAVEGADGDPPRARLAPR